MSPPVSQTAPPDRELPPEFADITNVLLLVPPFDPQVDEACARLLTPAPPDAELALHVTFTGSVDERLALWRDHAGELPAEAAIVSVGEHARSSSIENPIAANPEADRPVTIRAVADPADLTSLGIAISQFADQWTGREHRLVVCFDSLTTLLQYADIERVFRFVHVLAGRFQTAGTLAHYHLDPDAHDEGTVNTLASVFDAVVTVDEDGSLDVRSRSPT